MPLGAMKELAASIGCLHVEISDTHRTLRLAPSRHTLPDQVVPEKALKGQPIDMSAGFGLGTATKKPVRHELHKVGKPLAKFVIKYRSRRALQLLELIPTTPEPQLLEERDVHTLNPREMRQLLTHMREQGTQMADQLAKVKSEAVRVKGEAGDSNGGRRRRTITLEADDDDCVIIETKKRKIEPGEVDVLDLT